MLAFFKADEAVGEFDILSKKLLEVYPAVLTDRVDLIDLADFADDSLRTDLPLLRSLSRLGDLNSSSS